MYSFKFKVDQYNLIDKPLTNLVQKTVIENSKWSRNDRQFCADVFWAWNIVNNLSKFWPYWCFYCKIMQIKTPLYFLLSRRAKKYLPYAKIIFQKTFKVNFWCLTKNLTKITFILVKNGQK